MQEEEPFTTELSQEFADKVDEQKEFLKKKKGEWR